MDGHSTQPPQTVARIVGAFVGNNAVSPIDLPALIRSVHQALLSVGEPEAPAAPAKLTSAQIRKSIRPDALISFEDGKGYKTLKRHLTTRGMTLADYKTKWGLPRDYPTTSPNYSAARSAMAKALGLGRVRKKVAPATKPAAAGKPSPVRRGRPKKSVS